METAKLFQDGSSQAVRLPKAFRIPGNESILGVRYLLFTFMIFIVGSVPDTRQS